MRVDAPQRALPARGRAAAGVAGQRRLRCRGRAMPRRPRRHRHADGRRSTRCCGACRPMRRGRALAVQGLRGRQRRARPRDRAAVSCPRAARRRAVRARASRSRSRAASRPRSSPPASTPALARRGRRCAALRGRLRIYTSTDPVGVEVGGAVKNVLAIATGIADGMDLGLNARAALVTRGLAEMTRLGVALGRRGRDLHGPVGARRPGADRDRRRCRATARVGLRLAPARPAAGAHPARARPCGRRRAAARRWCCDAPSALGVEMPITAAVVARARRARCTPSARSRADGRRRARVARRRAV